MSDPLSPTPLSEQERRLVSDARELAPSNPDYPIPWDRYLLARLVAIIDRLTGGAVTVPVPRDPDLEIEFSDCSSCPEMPEGECPKSLRPCGHHCNHSWDQDHCHWCGVEFGEDGEETWPNVEATVDA